MPFGIGRHSRLLCSRSNPMGRNGRSRGVGAAEYAFVLGNVHRIKPNPALASIKIPDATPEIIAAYALTDEQALLAKVRYNKLVDVFLSIAAYSLPKSSAHQHCRLRTDRNR